VVEATLPKKIYYGNKSFDVIEKLLKKFHSPLVLIDFYFEDKKNLFLDLINTKKINIIFVDTTYEPSTDLIDNYILKIKKYYNQTDCVVAIGGGSVLDIGKAVSIMLKNDGSSSDYVGWNKVKNNAIYKIGIPTLFGTGSETTKTCVLLNKKNFLKLGINSSQSVFDEIILDYSFLKTAPINQLFYTGMDTFIHSFESLTGKYRNSLSDSYSDMAIKLFRSSFQEETLYSDKSNSDLVFASYFGGLGIASSYLGLVHPMSAALSVVFGTKHCVSNCMVMRAMKDIYPRYYDEFWIYTKKFKINIPERLCSNLTDEQYNDLYKATIIHEKPLENFYGENFKSILTIDYLSRLFEKI